MWFLLKREPRGKNRVGVRGSDSGKDRCRIPPDLPTGRPGDTHNGLRFAADPLFDGSHLAGQTACPAFDGYLLEESSNRRSGIAVDVSLLNDGEQEKENRRIRRRITRVSVANVEGSARAPKELPRNGESERVCGGV